MFVHLARISAIVFTLAVLNIAEEESQGQAPQAPEANNTGLPRGVEAADKGPVHEAFAAPVAEPKPAPFVNKKPPDNIDEMPPEEKPQGDPIWISGYWHWDDERNDYLWVSGCWRVKPPGKEWVPGYWREEEQKWQWVPGFWSNAQTQTTSATATQTTAAANQTYYPQPPAAPAVAAPPPAPTPDMIYVPGSWVWYDGRYMWRAGYWMDGRPGYVWVAAHYRWSPYGYVYIPGYWDLAVSARGVLYAPVAINVAYIGPGFVYTPVYAVPDSIVVGALFIRPAYCHYYFGNYYGGVYVGMGFESCFLYSRRHYEPIVAYQAWTYRRDPGWLNVQVNLTLSRNAGLAPVPTREVILRPAREVIVARGGQVVRVSGAERVQAMHAAREAHVAAVAHRVQAERTAPGHTLAQPRPSTNVNRQAAPYRPSPFGSAGKATGPIGRTPATTGRPVPGRTIPARPVPGHGTEKREPTRSRKDSH